MIFPFSEYFLLQLDLIECTQYGRKADLGEGFRAKALLCRRDIDTYSRNSVILNEEGSYIHPIDKRFARGKDLLPSYGGGGWVTPVRGFEEVSGREKGDVFSGQQQISYD